MTQFQKSQHLDMLNERVQRVQKCCGNIPSDKVVVTRLMFEITKRIESEVEKSMAQVGLAGPSWMVLMMAYSSDEQKIIASDISFALTQNKSTISRLVDSLIEKQFLVREYDKEDRRKIYLFITEEGKKFVESRLPAHGQFLEAIWHNVDTSLLIPQLLGILENAQNNEISEMNDISKT